MDRKIASYLSFAVSAGNLVSGETACEKALRDNSAALVIVASDASDNTKKKFSQKTFYYKVPFCIAFDKEELGRAIGKETRATVAVCDKSLARLIIENLQADNAVQPTEVFLWQE